MAEANPSIAWQSPEYVEHHHPASWYALLALGTTALAAAGYLITGDLFTLGVIVLLGIIVAIAASHKPKNANYELTNTALSIGGKNYSLRMFKSFSTADEGTLVSATLMPLKRFALPLAIYVSPQDADRVLTSLSAYLPHDEKAADAVDRLAHHLRF